MLTDMLCLRRMHELQCQSIDSGNQSSVEVPSLLCCSQHIKHETSNCEIKTK
jgi:hypothetical protein